jgi:MFS transporter, AAHS family, 4-hydroxybenzoate transporter
MARINVTDLIDNSRIGRFQIVTFTLCAASLIMDGWDVQAISFIGPEIRPEWQLTGQQFGQILSWTNVGVLIGSVVFTVLADKIGRRPVLITTTIFYSLMTLLAAGADSFDEMRLLRLIGGIGMGSIIPNATALIGELSPGKRRVTLIMTITVGFTAGAAVAAVLSAWLIPTFGWRSVLYVGGGIPLLVSILMFFWLPESLEFLILRNKTDRVGRWLNQIDPTLVIGPDTEYTVRERPRGGVPVVHLFRDGRAQTTVMFWIINFMNLLNLYFLAGWLPSVLADEGFSTSAASLIAGSLQVGGLVGTFGLAWLIGRGRFVPVLAASFALATASIALIGTGSVLSLVPALMAVVFVAGWCVIGGQPGLNAMAATYYPTEMRSTGVGFCLGVGRIGAIIGPFLGGYLIDSQWSNDDLFFAAASAALVAAVVMLGLKWTMKMPEANG